MTLTELPPPITPYLEPAAAELAKGVTGMLPVMFYIHGAGWVFGDEKTHDRLFRELAVGAGAVGVFPVYEERAAAADDRYAPSLLRRLYRNCAT
jgi:hypothetical protein